MKKYLPLVRFFSMLLNNFHQLEDSFSNPHLFSTQETFQKYKKKKIVVFSNVNF